MARAKWTSMHKLEDDNSAKAPKRAKRASNATGEEPAHHTSTPTSPAAANIKSPTQKPQELNPIDTAKLKQYLDRSEKPFAVHPIPASRKRKRKSTSQPLVQDDLFEDRLTLQYEIKPNDKWTALRKYKKFSVGSESIGCAEYVLVKHEDGGESGLMNHEAQWKAKVLEIRALDPEHVYIRVAWLNRPEDLEIGRKDYHGKLELIPTNQMDIIDAMAVNGRLQVMHWDQLADEDQDSMPAEDQYFWRYTYDFVHTKSFSTLPEICICESPQNPDELMVSCSNGECKQWMHAKCLADTAAKAAGEKSRKISQKSSQAKKRKSKSKVETPSFSPDSRVAAIARSPQGALTAEVYIKGRPSGPGATPAERDEIVITDAQGEKTTEKLCCLFCQSALE